MGSPEYIRLINALSEIATEWSRPELHSTLLTKNEMNKFNKDLEMGWFSSSSNRVEEFENAVANFTGFNNAIAVNSGTAALHSMLLAVGVKPEDEVIIPGASFVATANAVLNSGAVPHFFDIELPRLGISTENLATFLKKSTKFQNGFAYNGKSGRRIGAILNVDYAGYLPSHSQISKLAEEWGIPYLSDSAGSFGSLQNGAHVGKLADATAVSFNGNKVLTTGGGGIILTDDYLIAEKLRTISQVARIKHPFEVSHSGFGLNYRMIGLAASLGMAQLDNLTSRMKLKQKLHTKYSESIQGFRGAKIYTQGLDSDDLPNHWLNLLVLDKPNPNELIEVITSFHSKGLMVRRSWTPLSTLPHLRRFQVTGSKNTETVYDSTVMLPSSVKFSD